MSKLTYDEVRKRFFNNGYTLLEDEYIDNSIKMKCMDEEGYLFSISLNNINRPKPKVKKITSSLNPYALENMQHYININTDGAIVIGKELNANNNLVVELKCKCGKVFKKNWGNVVRDKSVMCPNCIKLKGSSRRLDFEFIKKEFLSYGLTILDNKYIANNRTMLCLDNNGYKVKMCYANLKTHKPYIFSKVFNEENYIYNVNNYFKLHNINCEAIRLTGRKMGDADVIECRCECGQLFETSMDGIKVGQYRCQSCSKHISRAEHKAIQWLKENNINYIYQYKTSECKLKQKLPFDFYMPEYNLIIEIDGEQHYRPAPFGGDWDNAYKAFEHTQKSDAIKNQYCKDKGINLVRIPATKFRYNKYKEILSNLFY